MSGSTSIIAVAALLGIGIFLIGLWLTPAKPALADAMSRMEPSKMPSIERETYRVSTSLTASQQRKAIVGHRTNDFVSNLPFVTIPTSDLAVLNRPTAVYIGDKVLSAGVGFLLPLILNAVASLGDIGLPWALPGLASFVLAAVLFFAPDQEIKSQAAHARVEFRRALGIYIDVVAMIQRSGVGGTQSLEQAALVGDSWVVRRIDDALQEAARAGKRPWNALKRLAAQLELKDLADVADIMTLGAEHGTQITESLRAKARSLRNAMVSEAAGDATAKTQNLSAPLGLIVVLFIVLILFAALAGFGSA